MAGLSQTVPALLWLICAVAVRETRQASLHWAAFSALGALSFGLFVAAQQAPLVAVTELLRAAGNVTAVLSMMALHGGIRLFIGKTISYAVYGVLLTAVLAGSWLGLDPHAAAIRVGVVCAVQAILSAGMVVDLFRYARTTLKLKLPWLLPLPALVCGLIYVERCLRAVSSVGAAQSQIAVASGFNVASAFAYMVVTLGFHAMLLSLVLLRLIADLRRMSRHDSLTGLLNRRALEEELLLQVQRSLRGGVPFSALMLDVDHFKRINDRLGHGVGDMALKHLAQLMRTQLRSMDTLGRIGGEEFLMVLPNLNADAALQAAERLRAVISNTPLACAGEQLALSVSIGVAQWEGHPEDTSRLLMRADAALYQAKKDGRDRVVISSPVSVSALGSGSGSGSDRQPPMRWVDSRQLNCTT